MWFERIVAGVLSYNSYMIGSGGKAAVIDPWRDCEAYLGFADRHDAVITHIFEIHRNEDYISGALELAHLCNAPIYHGSRMDFAYGKNRERVGHIPGSAHVYIGELPQHIPEIPKDRPFITYCDSGYKGSLAASVLAMHGFTDTTNVLGGMQAWVSAGYPVEH
jgi:3-mercaptopyruvate sulfurtransferase SseA